MCRRHSKLCITELGATGLRAVANTMRRWKGLSIRIEADANDDLNPWPAGGEVGREH